MTQGSIFRLVFESASTGGGMAEFVRQSKDSLGNVSQLTQGVRTLSQTFGTLGQTAGSVVSSILKGGIWGAAAAGVTLVVTAFRKWRDAAREAAEAQDRAMKESIARGREAAQALRESYAAAAKAIDEQAKRQKADIELTKQQTKASLELAAAKEKAAGNTAKAAELSRQAAAADRKAAADTAAVDVGAAQKKLTAAQQASGKYGEFVDSNGNFNARKWERARRRRNGRMMALQEQINKAEQERLEIGYIESVNAGVKAPTDIEALRKELETEQEARKKFVETAPAMRQAAENISTARKELDDAKKAAETVSSRSAAAEITAAAAAARTAAEKELRGKLAALQSQRSALRGGAGGGSSFQSQFEQAFDLWRDPEAAKAAQDEEKRRDADMKRFRKSVDRYGGKWRIDEYAELMRNGDAEGMQSRLAEWRKSSKFTPEVEQMVKAAAADQNANAAERALQNIEKNTADLAKKLDDLLSVK